MKLGCCYYPEHWPEEMWAEDARRMVDAGLSLVRIGEFAWSRIEPEYGRLDWDWLDRAIDTLGDAGLKVILGTPTATPPKWLIDKRPDMVPVGFDGQPRGFGSRRHYCFSHPGYREECRRIVTALAKRYGEHPAITAWQTDNEYGCHNTVRSYSTAAERRFRGWLADRYGDIHALNAAWGNVFWSMEYKSFEAVDLPNATVTEPNPAHVLDYRRFASDEVVSFNALQTEILREYSPGRDIIHNFMGCFTEFDHYDVSADLDVATWDSYPLGFLEMAWFGRDEKAAYLRQGHPDFAGFHHDLYRGCTDRRWGVMEQQPGPVNWARFNPAPLPGMVRLWTLEAYAHGAEFLSYFRWRQAPFAQEQMHAGLLRPDSSEDLAIGEAREAASVIADIGEAGAVQSPVALVFDYQSQWVFETQPQGASFRYIELAFEHYSALRSLGLDVDIVGPDAALDDYAMVVIPSLPIVPDGFFERLESLTCPVLIGPRSGSKTESFTIPETLAPGELQSLIPLKVTRVESLRGGVTEHGEGGSIGRWLEHVETEIAPECALDDGRGIVFAHDNLRYLAAWPDPGLLRHILLRMADESDLRTIAVPEGLRLRSTDKHIFAFNYLAGPIDIRPVEQGLGDAERVAGEDLLEAAGIAIWKR